MSHYRDDLDAAHARVSTLEAKLKEREAALDAREAELAELRAELTRARRGEGGGFPDGDARNGQRALLAALAACAFVMAAGYAMMRPRYCYQTTFATPPPVAVVQQDVVEAAPEMRVDLPDDTPAVAEFDRSAAARALGDAARLAKTCKRPNEPTGKGKVAVKYLPTGRVGAVQVKGLPYEGSLVGACVEAIFRSAKVPPFEGGPVSVTKNFSID